MKEKDWLAYYGQRFNCLEINSSYYRQNTPATYARRSSASRAGFQFAVKAFRTLTHEAGSDNEQDFRVFVDSLQPFLEAEEFACVLAQFPTSFHNTPDNRHYLAEFQDRFAESAARGRVPRPGVGGRGRVRVPAGAQGRLLRGGRAQARRPHAARRRRYFGPGLRALPRPQRGQLVEAGEGKDRYDYHYSKEELEEWVPKIDQVAEETSKIYIFMNNCFQGQAAANAMDIRSLLEIS